MAESQEQTVKENYQKEDTQVIPPSDDDARWMFDYRMSYWDLKAKLMGGELTQEQSGENKGNFVIIRKVGSHPFMNDDGINKTMAMLSGHVSKIQALSQLNEDRVLQLCQVLSEDLIVYFAIHHAEFGMSLFDASKVIGLIMDNYETNLRKSIGGQGLRTIGGSEHVIETRTDSQPKKKLFGFG